MDIKSEQCPFAPPREYPVAQKCACRRLDYTRFVCV